MRYLLLLFLFCMPAMGLNIGGKAPAIDLPGSDGKNHSLKEALSQNDAVVVGFIATKCPVSNAYNGRFQELVNEFEKKAKEKSPKKVVFFAINANETEPMDEVKKHAAAKNFTFPVLKDAGQKVADAYGAEHTPEVFLINKKSKVIYHGRIDDDKEGQNIKRKDLLAAVDEYLAGKKVSQPDLPAFGCSIKRK